MKLNFNPKAPARKCLYFWDDAQDRAFNGWWLAPTVGGDDFYAKCLGSSAQLPGAEDSAAWEMGNAEGAFEVLCVEAGVAGETVVVRTAHDKDGVGGIYMPDKSYPRPGSKAKMVYFWTAAASTQVRVRGLPVHSTCARTRAAASTSAARFSLPRACLPCRGCACDVKHGTTFDFIFGVAPHPRAPVPCRAPARRPYVCRLRSPRTCTPLQKAPRPARLEQLATR